MVLKDKNYFLFIFYITFKTLVFSLHETKINTKTTSIKLSITFFIKSDILKLSFCFLI